MRSSLLTNDEFLQDVDVVFIEDESVEFNNVRALLQPDPNQDLIRLEHVQGNLANKHTIQNISSAT